MALFTHWLTFRDVETLLRLIKESAEFFDPASYNQVFVGELQKLLNRIHDPDLRQQVATLFSFDFGNYISRSLKKAGYHGTEFEEAFQSICVKLLVNSKLFRDWLPQRHGPLEQRFKRSVWNAIRNIAEKTRNRRRWMTAVDPSVMAGQYAGRAIYNNIIGDFRKLVLSRLGRLALAILDARLAGEELKGMIGRPEFGSPSGYQLKREVGEIKRLAHQFAQQTGDEVFLYNVVRALDAEAVTVAKRQAARQAQ